MGNDVVIRTVEDESLVRCWTEARKLKAGEARAKATVELVRRLKGEDRDKSLEECEEAARSIANPRVRIEALVEVSSELYDSRKNRAIMDSLVALKEISDQGERAEAMAILAPILDEPTRSGVLRQALDSLANVESYRQSRVLSRLTPLLDSEMLNDGARLAKSITDAKDRALALGTVAAKVGQGIEDNAEKNRVRLLFGDWLWSIREAARPHISYFCTKAFFEPGILGQEALQEAFDCIREVSEDWDFG